MSELISRIDAKISEGEKALEHCRDNPNPFDQVDEMREYLRILKDCKAALSQQEAEPVDVREVFISGFRYCATEWCEREDLYSDVHSQKFGNEMEAILKRDHFLRTPKPAAPPQPVASVPQSIQEIAGQLYQCAGAYDMPDSVLDVLSALMTGSIPENVDLLPMYSPSVPQDVEEWIDENSVSEIPVLGLTVLALDAGKESAIAIIEPSIPVEKVRTFLAQRDAGCVRVSVDTIQRIADRLAKAQIFKESSELKGMLTAIREGV